jgi:transcriptional regulator with AAA-type ATPase domain
MDSLDDPRAARSGHGLPTRVLGASPGEATPRDPEAAPHAAHPLRDLDPTLELGRGAPLGRIWLCLDGAPGCGTLCVPLVPGDEVVVGGAEGAGLVVHDRAVSARHCRVAHLGHTLALFDLGSRNGVRVGGARVERAELAAGAFFEVGRTIVRVEGDRGRAAPEAAPLPGLLGSSRPMRRLAADVRRVARLGLPVLIRGESGSGKELVARAVHDESPRARRPFVALNAAAISRELAESELFGHERGAFTGALRERRGAFREAHQGTLFLDEIAALPPDLQAKLLRSVEEGLVRPLGAESPSRVDVRLVAATCEPLEAMVVERRFRGDLYERLAACLVRVPALRERPEDLPALARHLLAGAGLAEHALTPGALTVLRAHRFPGNVRELRNLLVQAALRGDGPIEADAVSAVLAERLQAGRRRVDPADALRLFEEEGRNVSAAARRAGVPRTTMRDLLRAAGARA